MSHYQELTALDEALLELFANTEQLDDSRLARLLEQRARLLQKVIDEATVSPEQVEQLVARSRRLKQAAEEARRQLADTLAAAQKGRRSTQAYAQVKQQE
jgi:hypothetical protein